MTAKRLVLGCLMVATGGVVSHAETFRGLELDFGRRAVNLRVIIDDLEDAYRVDPDGAIRMLANPAATEVDDREVVVSIAPGKRKTGVFRVAMGGRTSEVLVAADNRLTGPSRISGLPFGYAFLPPEGTAASGQTWDEVFPPPEPSDGPGVVATFRYTLAGAAPTTSCPECVEIRIVGLRRFVPGQSLAETLAGVFSTADATFYTTDQVFAVGTVLFSPKEGFFRRFELGMNTSMLTPVAVPGMMRRVVVERMEVAR